MTKKNKRLLLLALLLMFIAAAGIAGYIIYDNEVQGLYIVAMVWIVTVILLLWLGNRYIFLLLDKNIPWMAHTTRRFFIQISISAVYTLSCINLTYYLFKTTTGSIPPDITQMMVLNVYGLLFTIPVLSINFGIYFMMQWKKAQLQTNQLKEENLQAQLQSLRMQLDPHFLFNNLNVLASLIDKDPAEAQGFLDKFADVYRYVLQYKKEELVPLSTELQFIEAYCFLLKKRFGAGLLISLPPASDETENYCIPPLSLQMLVENAVKHNLISKEKPLSIRVFTLVEEKWVCVENTWQPLEKQGVVKLETGLENIRRRYQFLTDTEIKVSSNHNFFRVDLPLLEIDE